MVGLKGLPERCQYGSVQKRPPKQADFEALHAKTLTPLVGRDEEIDLLLRRWEQEKQEPVTSC